MLFRSLSADQVRDLVRRAYAVDPDDEGEFPLTAANDRNVWAPGGKDPQFGGSYLYDPADTDYRGEYRYGGRGSAVRVEDSNPHSLTALRDYARALAGGKPLLG